MSVDKTDLICYNLGGLFYAPARRAMTEEGSGIVFRYEWKYLISAPTALVLKRRLEQVLTPDPYALPGGDYRITSVYFDSPDLAAYREKTDGLLNRSKFRLRYYNDDFSFIRMEEKHKERELVEKTGVRIDRETADALLMRRAVPDKAAVLPRFLDKIEREAYRPSAAVRYRRYSYCSPVLDVRFSLDMEISGVRASDDLSGLGPFLPVLPPQAVICEVKYRERLPGFLKDLIADLPRVSTSFSKYTAVLSALFL